MTADVVVFLLAVGAGYCLCGLVLELRLVWAARKTDREFRARWRKTFTGDDGD